MSKLTTASYKGVRDFYPEDQFIENYIFEVWRKTSELFGYEEYNASILEPTEIYTEKSGAEIVNEQTFTFTDRGGRSVTLRPEMTPTLARMVTARRRELGFPLRWYSVPNLFRYEAPQRGRLREHWQLNVDVFGISNISAEIELIILADMILKNFGAKSEDYEIRLNTNAKDKNGLDMVVKTLEKSGISNIKLDPTLARGQAYYTGVIFEFFDTNSANSRALLGGGRYDNLTALFGDSDLPAAGFGTGDVALRDFLETHNLLPAYKPTTQIYMAITEMNFVNDAVELAVMLRSAGINVAIDFTARKIGDQLKAADKHNIPFVIVIGDDEAKSKRYKLKNMQTGDETEVSSDEIAACVK